MKTRIATLGACLAVVPAIPFDAFAQQRVEQQVLITAPRMRDDGLFGRRADKAQLARSRAATSDTAQLLQYTPGVTLYGAGGVSSLPAINGLADDRVRTQVDGLDLVAACPNHMNSALSYIDPSNVGRVKVYAGVTPVSVGGDSLGGTIQVESVAPQFAEAGQQRVEGQLGAFHRSNGDGRGGNLNASFATDRIRLSYSGAVAERDNYHAARDFKPAAPGTEGGPVIPGDEVASTAYQVRNQDLGIALRHEGHLLQLKLGIQHADFEGFPNQRMDMTLNHGTLTSLRYTGQFGWGELAARAFQQKVKHEMDMGPDRFRYGFGMPMNTDATTRGASLQARVDLGDDETLRLGLERQTHVLYDFWPPVGGTMGPNTFWNVDYGRRFKTGAYAEWEARWGPAWLGQVGLRGDRVMSDAGPVQGYDNGLGAIWGNDAAAFNARERQREDTHWDAALLARYTPSDSVFYELGLARKTRSPSLYQRYPWSTQAMAALMNNFVGDGNGYIGNPDLKPEVAHTLALSADWHDADNEDWGFKATAYVTQVRGFIDARRCDFGQCSAANGAADSGFVLLQYANQQARLQGLDLSGHALLHRSERLGSISGTLLVNQVRGRNTATDDDLYNLMPLNAKLTLQQQLGGFTAAAEWVAVAAKTRTSRVHNEVRTPGYTLLNLRGSYEWQNARLDLGVENLFNRFYSLPLGGAYVGQGPSMTSAGIPWGVLVPGMGRSIHLALNLSY